MVYTVAGGFAITKSGGGVMPQADLDTLMRSVTYKDAGDDPTAGDRTLTFTATDAGGHASTPAVATITVAPVNDAPVAVNDGPVSGNEDTPIVVNVLSNDTDVDDALDPTSVVITTTPPGATLSGDGKTLTVPGQGVWTVNPTSGAITFTPAADYIGTPTSITYTVKDASGAVSNSAVVSVDRDRSQRSADHRSQLDRRNGRYHPRKHGDLRRERCTDFRRAARRRQRPRRERHHVDENRRGRHSRRRGRVDLHRRHHLQPNRFVVVHRRPSAVPTSRSPTRLAPAARARSTLPRSAAAPFRKPISIFSFAA